MLFSKNYLNTSVQLIAGLLGLGLLGRRISSLGLLGLVCIIGKKRGRKQKIQRSILQSVVFQWYKIQYFFTGTNYLRLKLFVIRTFILFLKIKMYACRTFWLSCFFIKDVDNAAYTVGKTFQRGKRPVLLWQSRLKKMSSASGYERNGV